MRDLTAGMPSDILMVLLGAAALLGLIVGLLLLPLALRGLQLVIRTVQFNRHFRILKKREPS